MTLTPTGEMAVASGKGAVPTGPATTIPDNAVINFEDGSVTESPRRGEDTANSDNPQVENSQVENPSKSVEQSDTSVEKPAAEEPNPFELADALSATLKPAPEKSALEKPAAKAPEKSIEAPAPVPAGPRPKTGIVEVDEVLGRLPNSAFAKYKDLLPQWHEAYKKSQEAPKYLAAHSEAYKLTPEYQNVVAEQQQHNFEYRAFYQAALAVESGQAFKLLTGYDEKTNEPVYEVVKPDANGKIPPDIALHVRQALQGAQRNLGQVQHTVENFKQNHTRLVQGERQFIDESFKKMFKGIDESKFSPDEKKLGEQMKLLVPDSFSPEDARRLAHYSAITVMRLSKMVNDYMTQQGAKATVPKPRPGGGLTSDDIIPLDEDSMFKR